MPHKNNLDKMSLTFYQLILSTRTKCSKGILLLSHLDIFSYRASSPSINIMHEVEENM